MLKKVTDLSEEELMSIAQWIYKAIMGQSSSDMDVRIYSIGILAKFEPSVAEPEFVRFIPEKRTLEYSPRIRAESAEFIIQTTINQILKIGSKHEAETIQTDNTRP